MKDFYGHIWHSILLFLACTVTQSRNNEKIIQKPLSGRICDVINRRLIKKTLIQVLSLCAYPKFRYLSKHLAYIYRVQYEAAMLAYFRGTPTRQLENSVNIWNLLWISRQLIICKQALFQILQLLNRLRITR